MPHSGVLHDTPLKKKTNRKEGGLVPTGQRSEAQGPRSNKLPEGDEGNNSWRVTKLGVWRECCFNQLGKLITGITL
jgi:hypothetical protein